MHKPDCVRCAERLLWFSLGLDVLSCVILAQRYALSFYTYVFSITLALFFIYMIEKRINWIRFLFLCLYIISLPFGLSALMQWVHIDMFIFIICIGIMGMRAIALICLFQQPASVYFRKRHENAKEEEMRQTWRREAEEARSKCEEQSRKRAAEEQARGEAEEEKAKKGLQKYFDIFELPYSSNFDDVKKKYRIMIKLFHPDRHYSDETVREYAIKRTQEINEAFRILKKYFNKG